jgi:hypothetical protein
MGAVIFFVFSSGGSNVSPAETGGGTKFNPVFLLLLLCPLLHLFMMRGHGGNCHKQDDKNAECHDRKNTN